LTRTAPSARVAAFPVRPNRLAKEGVTAMSNTVHTDNHLSHLIDSDRKNYRRLFHLTFLVFLLIVAVGRLLPRSWRPFGSVGERETVFEEAQRAANTVLPFVFIQ
jgi:hypothetical protein